MDKKQKNLIFLISSIIVLNTIYYNNTYADNYMCIVKVGTKDNYSIQHGCIIDKKDKEIKILTDASLFNTYLSEDLTNYNFDNAPIEVSIAGYDTFKKCKLLKKDGVLALCSCELEDIEKITLAKFASSIDENNLRIIKYYPSNYKYKLANKTNVSINKEVKISISNSNIILNQFITDNTFESILGGGLIINSKNEIVGLIHSYYSHFGLNYINSASLEHINGFINEKETSTE